MGNEDKMVDFLQRALEVANGQMDDDDPEVTETRTFEAAGILCWNRGLVIRLSDGTEYQLTVVQSA